MVARALAVVVVVAAAAALASVAHGALVRLPLISNSKFCHYYDSASTVDKLADARAVCKAHDASADLLRFESVDELVELADQIHSKYTRLWTETISKKGTYDMYCWTLVHIKPPITDAQGHKYRHQTWGPTGKQNIVFMHRDTRVTALAVQDRPGHKVTVDERMLRLGVAADKSVVLVGGSKAANVACSVERACHADKCRNGGTCTPQGGVCGRAFTCACPNGWTGVTCETKQCTADSVRALLQSRQYPTLADRLELPTSIAEGATRTLTCKSAYGVGGVDVECKQGNANLVSSAADAAVACFDASTDCSSSAVDAFIGGTPTRDPAYKVAYTASTRIRSGESTKVTIDDSACAHHGAVFVIGTMGSREYTFDCANGKVTGATQPLCFVRNGKCAFRALGETLTREADLSPMDEGVDRVVPCSNGGQATYVCRKHNVVELKTHGPAREKMACKAPVVPTKPLVAQPGECSRVTASSYEADGGKFTIANGGTRTLACANGCGDIELKCINGHVAHADDRRCSAGECTESGANTAATSAAVVLLAATVALL